MKTIQHQMGHWSPVTTAETYKIVFQWTAQGRRLGDVARDVVERRLRFEPDPPSGGSDER